MGLKSVPSYPLTSPSILEALALDLRKQQESYYLISQIILETGMPLNRVVKLRVSDIKNKPKLKYDSRHNTYVFEVPISLRLQRDIHRFTKNMADDTYAFMGARSDKPMIPTAFQYALASASERIGAEPAITSSSLRKTFIYNTVLSDGNYVRAAHYTHSSGPKEVTDYLGVVPEQITFAQATKDFNKSIQRGAIDRTRKKLLKALEEAEHMAKHPEDRTIEAW